MSQLFRRLTVVLFVSMAAAVFLPALTAFGHADYDSSTPDKDEVVATAPTEIEAVFTQEIRRTEGAYYLRVEDASGTQVSDGDGAINDDDRTIMTATFPSALANGTYIVRWMTTSDDDGDADEGAFCFHVGDQPSTEQQAECAALAEEEEPTAAATTGGETPEATAAATSADTAEPDGSPTPADGSDQEDDDDSNTGIIIGIIVTVIAVIAVGGGIAVYMRQRQ
jgi:methionine-rich copper-binding protein CopC